MNSSNQSSSRSYSKTYEIIYSIYTFFKLCMILTLALFVERCSPTLNVYLILYCASEGYELMFLLLFLAHRYCLFTNESNFLIIIGQASYECFRFIIIIATTVELCKDSECARQPQGIIGLTLVTLGFFKYIAVTVAIIFYCAYHRSSRALRAVNEENGPLPSEDIEDLLNNFTASMPDSEPCSICMDINQEKIGVKLECKHFFHKECLKNWAIKRVSCPICRQLIQKR